LGFLLKVEVRVMPHLDMPELLIILETVRELLPDGV